MAKKYWVQEAFAKHKGALHKALGVPAGKNIPVSRLRKAASGKGGSAKARKLRKRAQLALTARKFKH